MCPEPEFGPEYRALIEIYRLAPEAAAGQLETILEHFFSNDMRKSNGRTKTEKKGSTPV